MTWLTQHPPGGDVVLLREHPGTVVRVDCQHCTRKGQFRMALLIRRYGPDAALPEVLADISGHCERRQDRRARGPCGAGFPALAKRVR